MIKYLLLVLISTQVIALPEIMKLMEISCEKKGIPKACYNLANMYLNEKNIEKSDFYYDLACKREFQKACDKEKWKSKVKKKSVIKNRALKLSKACSKLYQAIGDCEEFKCTAQTTISELKKVEHTVTGEGLNGHCKYSYPITTKKNMVCFMSKSSAKSFRGLDEQQALNLLVRFRKNGVCSIRGED